MTDALRDVEKILTGMSRAEKRRFSSGWSKT